MNHILYSYSLCVALPLMLFFGFYFILAPVPDKAIFDNYLRSRRIMGAALLLLAANYAVHFFFEIRFKDIGAAIMMNLSTYFLCYWLFSSALQTLLDRFYITRRRLVTHLGLWLLFTFLSWGVMLRLPDGMARNFGLLVMAVWLVTYGIILARRLILAYRRAIVLFDNTHSDDIGAYIKWLSVFTYWAVIFGVGCGLLTFLPDEYIYIWILSSVPFYVFLFYSYMNYLLFYEQVEQAFEAEIQSNEDLLNQTESEEEQEYPARYADIAENLTVWIEANGYLSPGLTIKELSDKLKTNRTYLSSYIKTTYKQSFREWITGLRIEHAKQILMKLPDLTIADVAERAGFQSSSHFIRLFKENEGCSPAKWKKSKIEVG